MNYYEELYVDLIVNKIKNNEKNDIFAQNFL